MDVCTQIHTEICDIVAEPSGFATDWKIGKIEDCWAVPNFIKWFCAIKSKTKMANTLQCYSGCSIVLRAS
jgi:hypothetical protein